MGVKFRRNSDCVVPFVVGLLLGLFISYGIRLVYKPGLCPPKILPILKPTHPNGQTEAPTTPDQIVNLAFHSHQKTEASDKSGSNNKSKLPKLCPPDVESCDDGVIGRRVANNKPRGLLFVGVMTANLFLETRAKAVWETWAKDIPGKVIFFTGGNSYKNSPHHQRRKSENDTIPLVPLPGVDDSYPPQKKSFMMLKYIYENYGDDYEWFMRADDDVYIRGDKMAEFLRSIDSRNFHFIGQAGKGSQMERGTLNLAHNENFCMGGPGIVLSRPTLEKVGPNVHQCLQDMYSSHEDVEIGRCVKRFAGISCTWAYEMQSVFHHNSSGELAFTGKLKRREVNKAITLHPIKDFRHLNRLHVYFKGLEIQELLHRQIVIHRNILSLSQLIYNSTAQLDKNSSKRISFALPKKLTGFEPSLNKHEPSELENVISWDFLGKGVFSAGTISPKSKLRCDGREALEDVVREVMDIINGHSRTRGRIVDFKEILYGYRRVNPLFGVDYVLDLLMTYKKYRGRKMTIPVRRHVYLQRAFSPLQIRLLPPETENSLNHTTHNSQKMMFKVEPVKMIMIVPLAGRYETFKRFLDNFSLACKDLFSNGNKSTRIASPQSFELSLVVVFFGSDEEKEKFLYLVQSIRESLSRGNNGTPLCKIKMVQIEAEFSRGVALETGISQCKDENLLFLIDVDCTFTSETIMLSLGNTVKGQQVYFPIVFSQHNPKFYNFSENDAFTPLGNKLSTCQVSESECQLNSDFGYWREFGFGITSFYKSDFRRLAGGFNINIKGWGLEDVELFSNFIMHTNLTVFRAPDPHLIHIFHDTECDPKLSKPQFDMCLGSQATTLGNEENLMKHLLWHNFLKKSKLGISTE